MSTLNVRSKKFDPQTGMSDEARTRVAGHLGKVLANSYMLFIKTQGVHWNVTGPAFYSVHKLTEEHYQNIFTAIDEIAERIRALGLKAPATYSKYGELSEIRDEEEMGTVEDQLDMLIGDHQTLVAYLRQTVEPCEAAGDYVTADMLIARMAWHEEAVWMLRSLTAQ